MLPESIDPSISLLDSDNIQINLVRWIHQCDLIKRYYHADTVFVVQQTAIGFEVIVSSMGETNKFMAGRLFVPDFMLFNHLINIPPTGIKLNLSQFLLEDLPREFDEVASILSRPILWPDGTHFGCLCVLNHHHSETDEITLNPYMLEPFQILLQQDLALLCQSHRIDSLSMRDRETGMLNHYGFIMMAPRQLNLGRRFGVSAALLMFDVSVKHPQEDKLENKHKTLLGNIIQSTIRSADIAAHYSDHQFIVLAFIDAARDMEHIIKRVEKQLVQQAPILALLASANFFTPDSTAKLGPMIEMTLKGLTKQFDNSLVENQRPTEPTEETQKENPGKLT